MITEKETAFDQKLHPVTSNWKNFDWRVFYYQRQHSFFNGEKVFFEDHMACLNLAGNELYYYPQLANALRELKEYPTLKRSYELDKDLQGIEFIENFYKVSQSGFAAFKEDIKKASNEVNHLLSLYGEQQQTPIITDVEYVEAIEGWWKTYVVFIKINEVKWFLKTGSSLRRESEQQLCHLDIAGLFCIDRDYHITVEDAIKGTAFIALRLQKKPRQKGRVVWYSLDTLEPVKKSEIKT